MNLRDLKYLVALAQHRHFGKAAKASFVTQPALSMQIKKLEDTLGVQLLERNNKTVMLTQAGQIIAERAQIILNQVDEIIEIAKLSQDPESGALKIGIIPTVAPYLLPYIISDLKKLFPKILFYFTEDQTAVLIDQLNTGKLDAVVLSLPIDQQDFSVMRLFEEEFLLAVSSSHPLAKRKIIKFQDIKQEEILLLEEGHCLREQALAICEKNKIKTQSFMGTSLETLRHMVAIGSGVTFMPQLACQTQDNIRYIAFEKKIVRTIAMAWRKGSSKHQLLNTISQYIMTALR